MIKRGENIIKIVKSTSKQFLISSKNKHKER